MKSLTTRDMVLFLGVFGLIVAVPIFLLTEIHKRVQFGNV